MFALPFDSLSQRIEVPDVGSTRQTSEFELLSLVAALRFAIGVAALLIVAAL